MGASARACLALDVTSPGPEHAWRYAGQTTLGVSIGGASYTHAVNGSDANCTWIHRERHRARVTLELLHHEYLEMHPGGLRYTTFCDRYRDWLGRRGLVMRQVHVAGDKAFVDYSGKKARIVDPTTAR